MVLKKCLAFDDDITSWRGHLIGYHAIVGRPSTSVVHSWCSEIPWHVHLLHVALTLQISHAWTLLQGIHLYKEWGFLHMQNHTFQFQKQLHQQTLFVEMFFKEQKVVLLCNQSNDAHFSTFQSVWYRCEKRKRGTKKVVTAQRGDEKKNSREVKEDRTFLTHLTSLQELATYHITHSLDSAKDETRTEEELKVTVRSLPIRK